MQTHKEKTNKSKKYKIAMQKHIIEEIGEDGKMQYNCTFCRKTFRSRSQRYYHINCNQLQNLEYKCEHCEKIFARQTQWKYHTESHISPVNECHKCKKIFSNPLALKKHEALHKVEPVSCPHCDRTFKKKISLDQHIAAQHLNQLQYGCAYCSKKYATKTTLQLHLQTHEKKRFECTICGKLFQRNSILNLHLKRHYNTNKYICTICQKVFSESGTLARHRKIHEESAIQYYCKLCDKSILRKDNMTRHLITIHPEEKFNNIVKITRPPSSVTKLQTNVESIEYDTCDKSQVHTMKSDKKIVIIENKLLHKPFKKKSETDIEKSSTSDINKAEYPLLNQIRVITAVSTYKRDVFSHSDENTSQELENQYKEANNQQQEKSILCKNHEAYCINTKRFGANYDFNRKENKVVGQNDMDSGNVSFVNPQIVTQELGENQEYINMYKQELKAFDMSSVNPQQSAKRHEPPITFPSVIRSVGNVKKNLTSHIFTPNKSLNQTSLEYKHKKYCRNNYYNIDLYRKILGCDEDNDHEDEEKPKTFDHMLKTSTRVHWRKSFKNNYETSAT